MRIAFFLDSLPSGGAERMKINLARELSDLGHRIWFVLTKREGVLLPLVPTDAEVIDLKARRTALALWPLSRFLRAYKPDVMVSSFGHNNIVAIAAKALARAKTRLIITQHAALEAECKDQGGIKYALLPISYRLLGRHADEIIAVSRGVKEDMCTVTRLPAERITVVYNPVVSAETERLAEQPVMHPFFNANSVPVFLAVGRLVPQKNFFLLIDAFAEVRKKRPVRLAIIGDGPLRASLEERCRIRNVAQDIAFLGFQENPIRYMKRASALIMSSDYEGFGNVLVEALAVGTPVISTDCPYGPAEILGGGRYGILVPVGRPEALAAAMETVIHTPIPASVCKSRASAFHVSAIAREYLALFETC
ncbi:MAG TPA: glycosyltransferase [Rhizomicrobium sp.]